MSYPVSQLLSDLNRRISPSTTDQSRDIFGVINEGARRLLGQIKPQELSRRVIVENALYDQVNRFHCPDDLDQKNVMQFYRLKGNVEVDSFYYPMRQTTNRRFDQQRTYDRNLFTIEWQSGAKFLKISDQSSFVRNNDFNGNGFDQTNNTGGLTINTCDGVTVNGLWSVFGNVVNLTTDNLTYVAGSGSLRFDINTSSNTGGILNTTITPVDLTQFLVKGKIFTWLDIPNLNQIQTVTLDLFSNPANLTTDYYSMTVTSPHDTPTFQLGQNQMGFIFDPSSGMQVIGFPDPANIAAIRVTFVTNGTLSMNSIRLDNIVARFGRVFGVQYISKYIFEEASSGIWKEEATNASDLIHLDFGAYELLLNECAVTLGQEVLTDTGIGRKGFVSGKLGEMRRDLDDKYYQYRKFWKSEFIDEQQQPYNFGVPFGYQRGWGGDNNNTGSANGGF